MQTSVIIISVLAITTVAYSFNTDKMRKFYDDFAICNKKLCTSSIEPSAQAVHCTLFNDGEMINANGEFINDIVMQRLDDLISDAGRLEQAREIHMNCYKEAVENGVIGNEQTLKTIACSMQIMGLLDKLK